MTPILYVRVVLNVFQTLEEAEADSNMSKRFASDDCLTALYMTVLLTTSYGFKRDTSHIKVTSKLGGEYIGEKMKFRISLKLFV